MTRCREGILMNCPSQSAGILMPHLLLISPQKKCSGSAYLAVCICAIALKNSQRIGLSKRNSRKRRYINTMQDSIILELTPHSPCQSGNRKGGSIKMIHVAGFSGIAGIIWAGESLMKMQDKLKDGKQCRDMSRK